jgi:hypothetical protein
MSELTYISTIKISSNIEDLKVNIIKTLARWFPNNYVFNECALESWEKKEETDVYVLYSDTFQFELCIADTNMHHITMYAIGRYRRHGSSCDFFEKVMDKLEYQLKHPEKEFATMQDCHEEESGFASSFQYTFSNSENSVLPDVVAESVICDEEEEDEYDDESDYDSDEDESEDEDEDEDDKIMNMLLRDMNDAQIEKYVELIGQCPRDECNEWSMNYSGGPILRYSYCKFIQWGIEDKTVSNITISCATFDQVTFTNYVFDNVKFEECVFKDVVLNNTTFKNSKFIDCVMDSSIVPDDSCEVITYEDYIDEDDYYKGSDEESNHQESDDEKDQRLLY